LFFAAFGRFNAPGEAGMGFVEAKRGRNILASEIDRG
jgi:hypothetical protein